MNAEAVVLGCLIGSPTKDVCGRRLMALETDRLLLRHPVEEDRGRFVELFTDEAFMVFAGRLSVESATARFDDMLRLSDLVVYAKQSVAERSSGVILGYTGARTTCRLDAWQTGSASSGGSALPGMGIQTSPQTCLSGRSALAGRCFEHRPFSPRAAHPHQ